MKKLIAALLLVLALSPVAFPGDGIIIGTSDAVPTPTPTPESVAATSTQSAPAPGESSLSDFIEELLAALGF